MAQKPYMVDLQQREQRQRSYLAAPVLAAKYQKVKEVIVEVRFVDPDGKSHPSSYKRKFTAEMQAYFDFPCPMKDCMGGGFDLGTAIPKTLGNRRVDHTGKVRCEGKRPRESAPDHRCNLELQYAVTVVR